MGGIGKEVRPALQEPRQKVISPRRAVFLDRDGTINEEVEFVRSPDELQLIPGAPEAIRALNQAGMVTCVISNQAGVARGFVSEGTLADIHRKLEADLHAGGATLDRIYYCPHHPVKGLPPYNVACECRKPSPGMLLAAARDFGIDLRQSYVIGDRIVDVQVARAVGARSILVRTGYGTIAEQECRRDGVAPDLVARSIVEAADFILDDVARTQS
jgi:D-glycero-D-manno-heptose 1,7-bisphosphate phosphatase